MTDRFCALARHTWAFGHNSGVPSPSVEPEFGVVCDVDGVLPITHVRRQLGRLGALFNRSPRDRRSVLGMPHLLRHLARSHLEPQVFYLTAAPDVSAPLITEALNRNGYPGGTALPAGGDLAPGWLVGHSLAPKRAALDRLAERQPQLRWISSGDDAGPDPDLFADFARRHPKRVAVIALRQDRLQSRRLLNGDDLPGVEGGGGSERRGDAAETGREPGPAATAAYCRALDARFLTAGERGNDRPGGAPGRRTTPSARSCTGAAISPHSPRRSPLPGRVT